MKTTNEKNLSNYREDAMTERACLICGEMLGKYGYVYRGKTVCRGCVEFIRKNC